MTEENFKKGQSLLEENKRLQNCLLLVGNQAAIAPGSIPSDIWEIGCNAMIDHCNNKISLNIQAFTAL